MNDNLDDRCKQTAADEAQELLDAAEERVARCLTIAEDADVALLAAQQSHQTSSSEISRARVKETEIKRDAAHARLSNEDFSKSELFKDLLRLQRIAHTSCTPGEYYSTYTGECGPDIDECVLDIDNCSSEEWCENTPGAFRCIQCPPNHVVTEDGLTCVPTVIDECAQELDDCPNTHYCEDRENGFECIPCEQGFEADEDGLACNTDIDECILDDDDCAVTHYCSNTPGSWDCVLCDPGFEASADGLSCTTDIDECVRDTDGCGSDSTTRDGFDGTGPSRDWACWDRRAARRGALGRSGYVEQSTQIVAGPGPFMGVVDEN
jgi:hypothetical protein